MRGSREERLHSRRPQSNTTATPKTATANNLKYSDQRSCLGFGVSQKFSAGPCNQNWAQLRADVKNCQFIDCPRNQKKLPLLFDRKEDTISKIRFIVLSQDPGASLRPNNPKMMEDYLIRECSNIECPTKGGLPARIREIFNKRFDPSADEVYWTHSLKCVPFKDEDINKEWKACARFCKDYFRREIQLIPSECLALIPVGRYALTLCRHLLEDWPLSNVGIVKYMQAHVSPDSEKPFNFNEKRVLIFPFIHPSHRSQNLKRYEGLADIEKRFAETIRTRCAA